MQAAQAASSALQSEVGALRARLAQQQAEPLKQRTGTQHAAAAAPDPPLGQQQHLQQQQQQLFRPAQYNVTGAWKSLALLLIGFLQILRWAWQNGVPCCW